MVTRQMKNAARCGLSYPILMLYGLLQARRQPWASRAILCPFLKGRHCQACQNSERLDNDRRSAQSSSCLWRLQTKTTMTHCQHHRLGTSGVLPSEEPAVHETGESANKCVCNSTMVEGRFAGDKLRVSSRRTGLDHSQAPPSAAEEGEWSGPGT